MARRNRRRLTCAHAFDDFLNNANPKGLAITTRVAANAVAAVRTSMGSEAEIFKFFPDSIRFSDRRLRVAIKPAPGRPDAVDSKTITVQSLVAAVDKLKYLRRRYRGSLIELSIVDGYPEGECSASGVIG
eukprot:scaffold230859_cov47-Attheya_sp.AAC.1